MSGAARALILGALLPLLLILWWHLASLRETTLVPTIGQVIEVLTHPFEEPRLDSLSLAHSVVVSVLRVLAGFTAALVLAVPLGVLVGRSRICRGQLP